MESNNNTQKDAVNNDVSPRTSRISGMPTVAELKRRVLMKQAKGKKGRLSKNISQ